MAALIDPVFSIWKNVCWLYLLRLLTAPSTAIYLPSINLSASSGGTSSGSAEKVVVLSKISSVTVAKTSVLSFRT
jgi:hypothetical protein